MAVVADGDEGADGNLLISGEKMDIEIEGGEGHLRWGQCAFGHLRCG